MATEKHPEGKTTVSHNSTPPRHSEASVSRMIDDVQPTSETLTGRAGLSLFVAMCAALACTLTWIGCLSPCAKAAKDSR